jgi:hypothetical protein
MIGGKLFKAVAKFDNFLGNYALERLHIEPLRSEIRVLRNEMAAMQARLDKLADGDDREP